MIFIDIIALIGGCLLSVCLIPQIYKVYESKNSDSISLSWQALYFIGLVPHLAYGIYYDLIPIYVPTIIELVLLIVLIIMKFVYKSDNDQS